VVVTIPGRNGGEGGREEEKVVEALARALDRADLAIGVREGHIQGWRERLLARASNYLSGTRHRDITSPVLAFRREKAQQYLALLPGGGLFLLGLVLAVLNSGGSAAEVDLGPRAGMDAAPRTSGRDRVRFAFLFLLYFNPWRFFAPLCCALVGVGLIASLVEAILWQNITTATMLFTLMGEQIGLMGIIADLIIKKDKIDRVSLLPAALAITAAGLAITAYQAFLPPHDVTTVAVLVTLFGAQLVVIEILKLVMIARLSVDNVEGRLSGLFSPLLTRWRMYKVLGWIHGTEILDVGCGLARLDLRLPAGFGYTGIDQIPPIISAVSRTGRRGSRYISFRLDGVSPLPVQGPYTDVALSAVLEHLEHPGTEVARVAQLTGPGGRVIITTPSPRARWILRLGKELSLLNREDRHSHERLFSEEELRALLAGAGLRTLHYERFCFGLNQIIVGMREGPDTSSGPGGR